MQYEAELALAKELATEAGKIIAANFKAGMTREWKQDGTPVTVTDTAINTLVIDKIQEHFPDHSVLGEEESHNLGQEFVWVCDPVDGTMPFSHGLPLSTFSLALVRDGVPVLGAVDFPFADQMFWAVKNSGAFLNGKSMHVSDNGFENALLDAVGFPSTKPVIQGTGDVFDALFAQGAKITSLWSAILPACLVAAGQYTATIFNVTAPQDGAAIKVIVEEAGGRVTDVFGNEQRYDQPIKGFVASNGVVHDDILEILKAYPAV